MLYVVLFFQRVMGRGDVRFVYISGIVDRHSLNFLS